MERSVASLAQPLAARFFAVFALACVSFDANAMSYAFVPIDAPHCRPQCPEAIVATGEISGREAEEFVWFVRHSGRGRAIAKMLLIHSPGGNAYGGMALGMALRQRGVTVVVAHPAEGGFGPGFCGSACVFVLAGGTQRIVPEGSTVGVHGARQIQTEVHDPVTREVTSHRIGRGEVLRMFGDYYAQMGVGRGLARISEDVPNDQVRILTPAEITRHRLARQKF